MRCVKAMKTGVWMDRLDDVKETEDLLIEISDHDQQTAAKLAAGN
jgi:hypothetical protein